MCGRFTLARDVDEIADAFAADVEPIRPFHMPRYNVAPTDTAPVAISVPGRTGAGDGPETSATQRRIGPMRWGFARPPAPGGRAPARRSAPLINARSETAATLPVFRAAFRTRRCLVPADGFYEWEARASGKQPYWIHRPDGGVFALAGIWTFDESGAPGAEGRVATFAILTRNAPPELGWLHHRFPVILPERDWDGWLNRRAPAPAARDILVRAKPPPMAWHPVARAVNRAGHDEPDCIRPVDVDPD